MLGNRMKKTLAILKIFIFGVILVGISILFWPFVLTGIILWTVFRGRQDHWITPTGALVVVLILRFSMNRWLLYFDMEHVPPGVWYYEVLLGLASWALGSIFVSAGYRMPTFFIDGLRLTATSKPASEIHAKPDTDPDLKPKSPIQGPSLDQ